ncbi:MAG TPA: prepilin-type N-terminal cleavage/methylation domain-containing protein [Geothrix sp.]|nr:prepilin-type N-terminal cleavage/methylation domain-containing protein [Geothrix sp.]
MAPTRPRPSRDAGYSLIELLVVLVIAGILTAVGVYTLGNRSGESVRVVLDQLEGGLVDAQRYAASTGKDVALVTWGNYDVTGTTPTMYMARGLTSTTTPALTAYSLAIQDVVLNPPAAPAGTEQTVSILFAPTRTREYMNAGVVTAAGPGSNWWTNVMAANSKGKVNDDIAATAPFNADASFIAAYQPANNLFKNALNAITISGANKRFNNNFFIQVVGTSHGMAIPGSAMGLIVVLNGGASVYKFYNPGVNSGDGKWRRI